MLTLLVTIFTRPKTCYHFPVINRIRLQGAPIYTNGQRQR